MILETGVVKAISSEEEDHTVAEKMQWQYPVMFNALDGSSRPRYQ